MSQAALGCLQRASQAAPDAVPAAAVSDLDAVARDLLAYTLETCSMDDADHEFMLPSGELWGIWHG